MTSLTGHYDLRTKEHVEPGFGGVRIGVDLLNRHADLVGLLDHPRGVCGTNDRRDRSGGGVTAARATGAVDEVLE